MRSSTLLSSSSRRRRSRFWRAAFLAALLFPGLLLLAPSVVRAQAEQKASGRLASVEIKGSHFTSEQIAKVLHFHAGGSVTREDLQSGADTLAGLGTFATVQYRFTTDPGGAVSAEYQVTDAPTVPVTFDNFPLFADEELTAAVKESVVLFDGSTAPKGGAILDAMSEALEKLIASRGLHSAVSHRLIDAPTGQTQMFRVEGPALTVAEVRFSDELAQKDPAVQERLADIVGKPFSRGTFQLFEFEQVRPIYLEHAFLRVKFGTPEARFSGNPNRPQPTNLVIMAPITRGSAYAWNGVTWSGNHAIDSTTLDKLAELKPGDTADGNKVELQWQRVRDLYASRGYLDATLDAYPEFDDAALRARYKVTVTEGPQYHMGKLILTGLSLDAERRIRLAWSIPQGAVFDQSIYEAFLDSGVKKAFYGLPIHYDKIGRFLDKDPKASNVDVMLDFQ